MTLSEGILPFKLIPDAYKSIVASFAGLPLIVETMRSLKMHFLIDRILHAKKRQSGTYSESDCVESFISLVAAGGSRLDDFARMQSDRGLKELGLLMPSSESARFFLYAFHEEDLTGEGGLHSTRDGTPEEPP